MSQRKSVLCSPMIRTTLQLTACIATVLVILMLCNIPATAEIIYAIDDGEQQYLLSSNATEFSTVLDEAGIDHSELDLVDASATDEMVSLSLIRRQYVNVVCDGTTTSVLTETTDTVGDVLDHLGIQLSEFDLVSVDPETPLDGTVNEIVVSRSVVSYETRNTPIPYDCVRQADPDMPIGQEAITTPGQDGSIQRVYRIVQIEDGETRTELISSTTTAPVDEVTSYGTKTEYGAPTHVASTSNLYITNIDEEAGTFTLSNGESYEYTDKLTLNATAYTARPGAICSTGRRARVGVVAVDPKYISYGTEMFIMMEDGSFVYGMAIAGDCGGAIDDNDVDLYMNTRSQCFDFGRHDVTAYILEPTEDA